MAKKNNTSLIAPRVKIINRMLKKGASTRTAVRVANKKVPGKKKK